MPGIEDGWRQNVARHGGGRHHRAGVIEGPNIVEDQQRRRSAESTEGAEALILDPQVGREIEIEESLADTGEINRRRITPCIDYEGAAWIAASMAPCEFASREPARSCPRRAYHGGL